MFMHNPADGTSATSATPDLSTAESLSPSTFATQTLSASAHDVAACVRVLLVDDQDDALTVMNLLFKRRDFAVQTASSAQKAMEVAHEFEPHLVVSDLSMPDMNGYEMMSQMRASDALKPFKSIALSGYDREDDRLKSREAGFDAHLAKPIDFDQLFATVQDLTRES